MSPPHPLDGFFDKSVKKIIELLSRSAFCKEQLVKTLILILQKNENESESSKTKEVTINSTTEEPEDNGEVLSTDNDDSGKKNS